MAEKGLIHIYTGEGKGKTTSAIGLALRARSRGNKILFAQFFKEKDDLSELSLLEQLGVDVVVFDAIKSPFFHPSIGRAHLREETEKAVKTLQKVISTHALDLVILDEFICLVSEDVISESEAIAFMRQKPEPLELVLTGRGATEGIMAEADYVTYMKHIKHPYDRGIKARRGIEI
ncbi:MAG: cob(I)yrinic acid a,c-diamide adenosyltransferase [Nitrospirae bacterium]|nr:cob(I)yrinic acid a,c-diamide adenosyltransferase [Nitrospirota bacterium]